MHFLSVYLTVVLSVCLTDCCSLCLSVCLSVCQLFPLSVFCLTDWVTVVSHCLSICLSFCCSHCPLSEWLTVVLSVCLSFCCSHCLSFVWVTDWLLSLSVWLTILLNCLPECSHSLPLAVSLSVCLSVCLLFTLCCLSVVLTVCLSVCLILLSISLMNQEVWWRIRRPLFSLFFYTNWFKRNKPKGKSAIRIIIGLIFRCCTFFNYYNYLILKKDCIPSFSSKNKHDKKVRRPSVVFLRQSGANSKVFLIDLFMVVCKVWMSWNGETC